MASFSKLARWNVGYFRAFSRWLLQQGKTVSSRAAVLNAEIERIGFIKVAYRGVTGEDGSVTMTEQRLGFSVTEGTNLSRLVQAYIVNGGNPFDISPFWMPGQTKTSSTGVRIEVYPHGGLLSMISSDPSDPKPVTAVDDDGNEVVITSGFGGYPGGSVASPEANMGIRIGTRAPSSDLNVVRAMRKMRDWANQDIKEQLSDIEWRIIKQMDLREQLEQERDDLLAQAWGGALDGAPNLGTQRVNPSLTVQSLIQDMYEIVFEVGDDGTVKAFRAGPDLDFIEFAVADLVSEIGRDNLS
jgi:hypothetical protein